MSASVGRELEAAVDMKSRSEDGARLASVHEREHAGSRLAADEDALIGEAAERGGVRGRLGGEERTLRRGPARRPLRQPGSAVGGVVLAPMRVPVDVEEDALVGALRTGAKAEPSVRSSV